MKEDRWYDSYDSNGFRRRHATSQMHDIIGESQDVQHHSVLGHRVGAKSHKAFLKLAAQAKDDYMETVISVCMHPCMHVK